MGGTDTSHATSVNRRLRLGGLSSEPASNCWCASMTAFGCRTRIAREPHPNALCSSVVRRQHPSLGHEQAASGEARWQENRRASPLRGAPASVSSRRHALPRVIEALRRVHPGGSGRWIHPVFADRHPRLRSDWTRVFATHRALEWSRLAATSAGSE